MEIESIGKKRAEIPKGLGAILVFTEGSEKGRQFPLIYLRTVLGRKKGDILIRDLAVSSEHTAVDYRRGVFHVVDLDSKNGTYINEKKIRDQQVLLEQDIRIGDSLFHIVLDPEQAALLAEQQAHLSSKQRGLVDLIKAEFLHEDIEDTVVPTRENRNAIAEALKKKYIRLKIILKNGKNIKLKYVKPKVLIGREETDLVINDIEVSRKHAYLELQNQEVILQDLASANGTYVNGKRINRRMLNLHDKIQIGHTLIVFMGVQEGE